MCTVGDIILIKTYQHKDGNTKDGYVKAEQFYYFNSHKIDYTVIGKLHPEVFNRLVEFIEGLDVPIEHITDNL